MKHRTIFLFIAVMLSSCSSSEDSLVTWEQGPFKCIVNSNSDGQASLSCKEDEVELFSYIREKENSGIKPRMFGVSGSKVMIEDLNGDMFWDKVQYDSFNENNEWVASSTDLNNDGTLDFRIDAKNERAHVWLKGEWHPIVQLGKDNEGKYISGVNIGGKMMRYYPRSYPPKLKSLDEAIKIP